MSAAADRQLGGFEQRLLVELRGVVAEHAAERAAQRAERRRPVPRRSLAMVLAGAAVACVAVLIAVSAGSSPPLAQAFPILARPGTGIPATLASFLRDNGVTRRHASLDVRHARAFRTPLGTGYVLTDRDANLMCVAAPGFAHDWGASCGNAARARRLGAGDLETWGPRGVSFVAILPTGATATVHPAGGAPRPAALRDGVLAFVSARPVTVTIRIDGHATTLHVPVPTRPARMPVPSRSSIATTMRLHSGEGHGVPTLTATFRARYPARRGVTEYVLEIAPLTHPAGCSTGDTIEDETTGSVRAGQLVALSGGAPNCAGPWRVTVSYAVPNGAVRYPGSWPQGVGTASTAPRGSGAQIVATRVITVPSRSGPTGGAGRGPRTSPSGG